MCLAQGHNTVRRLTYKCCLKLIFSLRCPLSSTENNIIRIPGSVPQSVTCLASASLTADPGVASSIPARSHTFVEIDHEIISSAESFKKGCC